MSALSQLTVKSCMHYLN